jgi:hypothetical protein
MTVLCSFTFNVIINKVLQKAILYSQVLVAHACNPNYPGGRDQEDHHSRSALANSSKDPISKISNTKQNWWSGSSD